MFKKLLLAIGLIAILVSFPLTTEARSYRTSPSDVYVKGYYKKNGTYVAPYYRTAPNSTKLDNYSCLDYGNCGTTYKTPTFTPVYTPTYTPTYVPTVNTSKYDCTSVGGINSFYNFTTNQCDCSFGYAYDSSLKICIDGGTLCRKLYGSTATYNMLGNTCSYTKASVVIPPANTSPVQAVKVSSYTSNPCPEHASIVNATCRCDSGYEFTHGDTRCSKKGAR
jgi:hypothetical protein